MTSTSAACCSSWRSRCRAELACSTTAMPTWLEDVVRREVALAGLDRGLRFGRLDDVVTGGLATSQALDPALLLEVQQEVGHDALGELGAECDLVGVLQFVLARVA